MNGIFAIMQVYLRDDMVIREGEVSREMYFIKSGAVQARSQSYWSWLRFLIKRVHVTICKLAVQHIYMLAKCTKHL